MPELETRSSFTPDLAEEDILDAMRQDGGYFDVSPGDALALYRLAYAHAAQRFARDAPVRELMTQTVIAVALETEALAAAQVMASAGVSGLPVLSGEEVAGVLSIKDLLRLLDLPVNASAATLVARSLDPAACVAAPTTQAPGCTPVSALMSSPALVIGPDARRSDAARLMVERGVKRLPVVAKGRLCGIVTRGDITRSCRGLRSESGEQGGQSPCAC